MKAFNIMMIVMLVAALVAAEAVAPPNMSSPLGVSCDVLLVPCLEAFTSKANPSPECCKELKEQEPCFCKYMKDPNLKKYLDSPNGKNVLKVCMITFPKCF